MSLVSKLSFPQMRETSNKKRLHNNRGSSTEGGGGLRGRRLTKNSEQTDEYCSERSHAQLQRLALLHEFTVLPPEPVETDASVAQSRVLVDAHAAVTARAVQALVLVCAALTVGRHDTPLATTVSRSG